ncbi:hypothetical protein C8R44DRAFT_747600 [Mycena epipterygia]|nr:hypothetical protein C8R44DRAFT_747600 [Mycena epipterygia]
MPIPLPAPRPSNSIPIRGVGGKTSSLRAQTCPSKAGTPSGPRPGSEQTRAGRRRRRGEETEDEQRQRKGRSVGRDEEHAGEERDGRDRGREGELRALASGVRLGEWQRDAPGELRNKAAEDHAERAAHGGARSKGHGSKGCRATPLCISFLHPSKEEITTHGRRDGRSAADTLEAAEASEGELVLGEAAREGEGGEEGAAGEEDALAAGAGASIGMGTRKKKRWNQATHHGPA